ncbi:MAG TPA: hypothetical protein VF962_06900, partial [Gemmatimonadaceae bacterium]
RTPRERKTRKLLAPVLIMLGGIDVYRFVHASVHGEVGLLVANQVESVDAYPARYGSLEDRSRYGPLAPLDFARTPDVYR